MCCIVSVVWVSYNNSGIEPKQFVYLLFIFQIVRSYYDWTFIPSIQMLKTPNRLFCLVFLKKRGPKRGFLCDVSII